MARTVNKGKFWLTILLLVLATSGAKFACSGYLPLGTWHYKMIVEVETPEGIKTGSAVREVTEKILKGPINPQMSGVRRHVRGEAVVVDLGKRGVLFALISGDYGHEILFSVFPDKEKKGKATLKLEQYPIFVHFQNIDDPKTVEKVLEVERVGDGYPIQMQVKNDRFEEIFGQGVRLRDATIEITDEPITWEIQKYLKWLPSVKMSYLSGKQINGTKLYEQIGGGYFQKGEP